MIGETLTVTSLMPLSGPQADVAADIVDGEKLALAEAGGRAGPFAINFTSLDSSADDPGERAAAAATAARQVISDGQTVAVIGPLESDAAMLTVPLLNAAGLLQVSPAAGYAGLTGDAGPGEPERFYPAGERTFFRTTGDDRAMARAMARAAGDAEIIAVEREPGRADEALARELERAVRARGARLAGNVAEADAVLYAGDDVQTAAAVAEDTPLLVAGDALARAGLADALDGEAARRTRLVRRAPAAPDPGFARRFAAAFGREPGPYAELGHDAMRRVLRAIATAGTEAARRPALIEAFAAQPAPAPAFRVETAA